MAVRIRLRRMGRKKLAHYRIVVADSASPRDGRFVETLGYYKPLSDPARLVVDLERVDHWIGQGAQPSDTVRSLLNKARRGGDSTVAIGELSPEEIKDLKEKRLAGRRKSETAAREAAAEAEAAAEVATAAAAEVEAAEAAEAEAEATEEETPEEETPEAEADDEAKAE